MIGIVTQNMSDETLIELFRVLIKAGQETGTIPTFTQTEIDGVSKFMEFVSDLLEQSGVYDDPGKIVKLLQVAVPEEDKEAFTNGSAYTLHWLLDCIVALKIGMEV